MKIEMHSNDKYEYYSPHVFTYNRKSGKLSYDSIQMPQMGFLDFDENFNLIENKPIKDDLSGNKKVFKQVIKLVKNALAIEKEFGHPQDIEGGLLGDDIYLWQTRNIVNRK